MSVYFLNSLYVGLLVQLQQARCTVPQFAPDKIGSVSIIGETAEEHIPCVGCSQDELVSGRIGFGG